jgi:hypothetical protein
VTTLAVRLCGVTVARVGVARLHRHLPKAPRSGLAAFELVADGWPIGWMMIGRPGAPALQALGWVEVTRVAVPAVADGGPWGGCSALYQAAARWAWEKGAPLITYTLSGEGGAALRGAGWIQIGRTATRPSGRSWSRPGRPRAPGPTDHIGKKRWIPGDLHRALVESLAAPCLVRP